jgi:hypothetical protein
MSETVGDPPWEVRWELRFLDGKIRSGTSYRHAYDDKGSVISWVMCSHRYGWGDFSSFKSYELATSQLVLLSVERAIMPADVSG